MQTLLLSPLVPPDERLPGRWTRTLLETNDGHRDATTEVTWLQGGRLYVDLRLPQPAPEVAARCLRELTHKEAEALAAVEGFAGELVADGPWACWQRAVDLQPAAPTPDEGRLDVLHDAGRLRVVETGRDGSYREHWSRGTGPTQPRAGLLLADPASAARAVLVRVGDDVAWAYGRRVPLPPGGTLAALLESQAAQEMFDAEVSLAGADGTITSSSLPWRVGARVGLNLHVDLARTAGAAPDGSPLVRTWSVVAREGDPACLPSLDREPP